MSKYTRPEGCGCDFDETGQHRFSCLTQGRALDAQETESGGFRLTTEAVSAATVIEQERAAHIIPGGVRVSIEEAPALKLLWGGCSERGKRETQEDALGADSARGVFAVADGLGAGGGGDVAADAAVSRVMEFMEGRDAWSAERFVVEASEAADTAVRQAQAKHWGRCQTTLAVLAVRGQQAAVAWCGDSRVYRLRGETLERLTQDHRIQRHVLAKYLGSSQTERSESDFRTLDVQTGDVFLLCTDGVGDTLPEKRIRESLLAMPPPAQWNGEAVVREAPAQWSAESIVREALDRGSKDNCTAIVVCVRMVSP